MFHIFHFSFFYLFYIINIYPESDSMRTFSAPIGIQRKRSLLFLRLIHLNETYQISLDCLVPDTSAFSVSSAFVTDSVFERVFFEHVLLKQLTDETYAWTLSFYNPTQIIWITIVVYRRHAIRLKYICTIGAIVFHSSGYIA